MNYTPAGKTVVCGRGNVCANSPGNKRLKSLVKTWLQQYSQAKTKVDKSAIVSCILRDVKRAAFPEPAFVKPTEDKVYCEVTDAFAREKIGSMFRDILHTQYKSSNKAKNARKRAAKKPTKCITDQREVTSAPQTIFLWETNDTSASPTYPEDCQQYVHPFRVLPNKQFSKFNISDGFFKASCRPLARAPRQVSIEEDGSLSDSLGDIFLNDDDFSVIDDLDLPTSMSDLFC